MHFDRLGRAGIENLQLLCPSLSELLEKFTHCILCQIELFHSSHKLRNDFRRLGESESKKIYKGGALRTCLAQAVLSRYFSTYEH